LNIWVGNILARQGQLRPGLLVNGVKAEAA
jgi:hypothetical protein